MAFMHMHFIATSADSLKIVCHFFKERNLGTSSRGWRFLLRRPHAQSYNVNYVERQQSKCQKCNYSVEAISRRKKIISYQLIEDALKRHTACSLRTCLGNLNNFLQVVHNLNSVELAVAGCRKRIRRGCTLDQSFTSVSYLFLRQIYGK